MPLLSSLSRACVLGSLCALALSTGCSLGLKRKVKNEEVTRTRPAPADLRAEITLSGRRGTVKARLESAQIEEKVKVSSERWFYGNIYSSDREMFMVLLYPLDAIYNLGCGLEAAFDSEYDVRWGPLGVLWAVAMPGVTCAESGVSWGYVESQAIGAWDPLGEEVVSSERKVTGTAPLKSGNLQASSTGGFSFSGKTDGEGHMDLDLTSLAMAYLLSSSSSCTLNLGSNGATAQIELPDSSLAKAIDALPAPENAWHWAHVLGHTRGSDHRSLARAKLKSLGYPEDFVSPSLTAVLVGATPRGPHPDGGQLDWSKGTPDLPPSAKAEVLIGEGSGGGEIVAGEALVLRVRVSNVGHGSLYQVRGEFSCDELDVSKRVILFGRVDPGLTVERTIRLKTPKTLKAGGVTLRVRFREANGYPPAQTRARFAVKGADRPAITLSVQPFDDGSGTSTGNGDGVVQRGEAVELRVTVNNLGGVGVQDATLSIHVPETAGIRLFGKRSFDLGAIRPGASLTRAFTISVKPGFTAKEVPLEIRFRETSVFKISKNLTGKVQIDQQAPQRITSIDRPIRILRKTPLLAGASDVAKRLGEVEKGALLRARGQLGEYLVVSYGERRAWVSKGDVEFDKGTAQTGSQGPGKVTVVKEFANTPPLVALRTSGGRTPNAVIRIRGKARDDKQIRSLEFRVDGTLIDPAIAKGPGAVVRRARKAKQKEVVFEVSIPLHPGKNRIEVVATDDQGLEGRDEIVVDRADDRGQVHAVVIGISAYTKVRKLSYARQDAIAFRDYLRKDLGVPAKNIHLLVDEQATLPRIKRLLGRTLPQAAGKNDTVLLYFSGHGGREADTASDSGQSAYLYPVGADEQDLISTAYPMVDLERSFRRIQAQRVVFLADSCYSGAARDPKAAAQAKGSVNALRLLSKSKGRVILSACQADQVAQESNKHGHGLFTHYVLEGLQGARADIDGDSAVDTDELYSYVSRKVSKASRQTQHPEKSGSGRVVLGAR